MASKNSTAKPAAPDVRTDPATKAVADRLDIQYHRVFQVQGTLETVMQLLHQHYEDMGADEKLTPIWSALSLSMDTLEDIAEQLDPPVMLKKEVAHVRL